MDEVLNRISYDINTGITFNLKGISDISGEEIFKNMAIDLQSKFLLSLNGSKYQLKEIEFYYWSKKHKDPFVPRIFNKSKVGHWVFDPLGLFITIGTTPKSQGGILIRTINHCLQNRRITGLNNIVYEVSRYLGSCTNSKINFEIVLNPAFHGINKFILPYSRVNLGKTPSDGDSIIFREKKYNFQL